MVKSLISGNMEENKILGEHSDLFQIIKDTMELKDIDIMNYSPLTLAYICDGIYEIVIRQTDRLTKFIRQHQIL